jgi:hypothetical protein
MLDSAIEELAHAEFGHVFLPLFLAILSHAAMLSRVVAHAMSHALSHTTLLSNYNLKKSDNMEFRGATEDQKLSVACMQ